MTSGRAKRGERGTSCQLELKGAPLVDHPDIDDFISTNWITSFYNRPIFSIDDI